MLDVTCHHPPPCDCQDCSLPRQRAAAEWLQDRTLGILGRAFAALDGSDVAEVDLRGGFEIWESRDLVEWRGNYHFAFYVPLVAAMEPRQQARALARVLRGIAAEIDQAADSPTNHGGTPC